MASTVITATTHLRNSSAPAVGLRVAGRPQSPAERERHRLARELHDAVIQPVLAAGLAIARCRAEMPAGSPAHRQLEYAERLTRAAVRRLRSSMHGLSAGADTAGAELPDLFGRLADGHADGALRLSHEVSGTPVPLPPAVTESLYRIAGECLFNSAVHGRARRAVISLAYGPKLVELCVTDDGQGDPDTIRMILRGAVPDAGTGHTGLADIASRAEEIGATVSVGASSLGGIALRVLLPAPAAPARSGGDKLGPAARRG